MLWPRHHIMSCASHKADYENYEYFAVTLSTPASRQPFVDSLVTLSVANIECLGQVGALGDVMLARVAKAAHLDVRYVEEQLKALDAVQSVEHQVPKMRVKK